MLCVVSINSGVRTFKVRSKIKLILPQHIMSNAHCDWLDGMDDFNVLHCYEEPYLPERKGYSTSAGRGYSNEGPVSLPLMQDLNHGCRNPTATDSRPVVVGRGRGAVLQVTAISREDDARRTFQTHMQQANGLGYSNQLIEQNYAAKFRDVINKEITAPIDKEVLPGCSKVLNNDSSHVLNQPKKKNRRGGKHEKAIKYKPIDKSKWVEPVSEDRKKYVADIFLEEPDFLRSQLERKNPLQFSQVQYPGLK